MSARIRVGLSGSTMVPCDKHVMSMVMVIVLEIISGDSDGNGYAYCDAGVRLHHSAL
jgi:hypothetical protein